MFDVLMCAELLFCETKSYCSAELPIVCVFYAECILFFPFLSSVIFCGSFGGSGGKGCGVCLNRGCSFFFSFSVVSFSVDLLG